MRVQALVTMAAAVALLSCRDPLTRVPSGAWGGNGALMMAADSGASLQFNCASGTVDEPLDVAADGSFSWNGTYLRVSGAPGAPPDTPHAAVYSGTASGTRVMLAMDVPDYQIHDPPVELVLDRPAQLALCP